MINLKEIKNTLKMYENRNEQLKALEKLKENIKKELEEIQTSCLHDIILIYSYSTEYYKKGKCLLCNTDFEFDKDLLDYYSETVYDEKYVIDITNEISKFAQHKTYNNENVLYLRAKQKLNEIIKSNIDLSLGEIKSIIKNDLICYDRELRGKKLILAKK